MLTRQLGHTDLHITTLGFGAWAIGGAGWTLAWGAQDDEQSVAAIREAVAAGMNWIDTAPIYGRGHSERVIGRALAGMRERPILATKCGRFDDDEGKLFSDLCRDTIRREFERSLELLGVDKIDLYQIHFPEDAQVEEGWRTLVELKQEGLVGAIGVSNYTVEQMKRSQAIAPIDSCQPAYSLVDRAIEQNGVLEFCVEHGIGVIVYSPQGAGLLTGAITRERLAAMPRDDWRVKFDVPRFREPELSKNLALVELLREIGARHGGRTPGEVAIAWTLRQPAVTAAIVGLRSPSQVAGVAGAAEITLTAADLAGIEAHLARPTAAYYWVVNMRSGESYPRQTSNRGQYRSCNPTPHAHGFIPVRATQPGSFLP